MPPELALAIFVFQVVVWLIIHVAFAFAVGIDAGKLPQGRKPLLVGRWIWFFTVLIAGPLFAIAYWGMHHSMVSPFVYNSCAHERDIRQKFE